MEQLLAFMEEHPIDTSEEFNASSPRTKRRKNFLDQPTIDMEDQITSQNSTMSKLLQSTEDKKMNLILLEAEMETAPSTEKKRPLMSDRLNRQDLEAEKVTIKTLGIDEAAEFYATMSAFSKSEHDLTQCPKHPNRHIEYFSVELEKGLCPSCVYEEDEIDKTTLSSAKTMCDDMMKRWVNLIDNATYMPIEHLFKEKDFGIRWRTAFKAEIKEQLKGEFE